MLAHARLRPAPGESPWLAGALAAGAATAVGVLAAAATPQAVAAGMLALAVLALALARPVAGVFLFLAAAATLPFGVIPVQVGVQLTFVDVILIATFLAFLVRLPRLLRQRDQLALGAPSALLLLFVAIAGAAFLAGSGRAPTSPEVARRVAKLLVSLLFFPVAGSLVRERATLLALTRALMLAGAFMGAVGTALWLLPAGTQLRLLTSLKVIGYPTANVLRFVPGANQTYTNQLRAIGTSVDPNVFGGTLMLALAVIVVQWAARRPLLGRPALVLLALPTLSGMLLSQSRASWLGLAAGVALVGALRYRRLWLVAAVALVGLLALPMGQAALGRFASGLSVADRATAFRFGEYANALTIIQRYPLLGIGFGPSPDIDVTAGVSSVYLLVGEQTGLIGLAVYLAALGATWLAGARALRLAARDPTLEGVLVALLAAVSGALVTGCLDHYFANQAFPHAVALFWLYAAALVVAANQLSAVAPTSRGR